MEILFENAKPADLTAFSRALATRLDEDTKTGVSLATFLPNRVISGTKSRITRASRTATVARVRAFDAATPVGRRPLALSRTEVGLAPLGQKLPLREEEILLRAIQGEDYAEVVDAAYDDAANNVSAIHNLMETFRAQFLFTGSVTIDDNGFIQEADFGIADDHNLDQVDVGANWATATFDNIGQELSWVTQVQQDADAEVVAMITSRRVLNLMMASDVYKTPTANVVNRNIAQFNANRVESGLPPVYVYDKAIGGTRLTPDNKIALVTSTVGESQWGDTAEAFKLLGSNAVEESGVDAPAITTASWLTEDPVNVWTKSNATALPVAGDINGLFVAEVTAV